MRLLLGSLLGVLLLGAVCLAGGLNVVASIYPLYEIARAVGGPEAEVHLLLPPGADPHTWEPTPRDILRLGRADLLVAVGGGLEPWLDDLLAGLRPRETLLVLDRATDPHVWLDFREDAALSLRLGDKLAALAPESARSFRKRAEALAARFRALHRRFAQTLSRCRTRTLVLAGHNAFARWEALYGLKVVSLAGPSPEAEPTPRALRRAVETVRREGLSVVFYEEPASRRFAEIVARETGARPVRLHTGASLTREELAAGHDFFALMEENLDRLREGLGCRQGR